MKARLSQMARAARDCTHGCYFAGHCLTPPNGKPIATPIVFVLPSQNENFGNTAAEATAAGTPVVVTEDCGIAPLLAGIAGLVVPHNAQAISRAIERVLTEPDLHAQLSAGCKKAASRLGWEEPAQEMESLVSPTCRRREPRVIIASPRLCRVLQITFKLQTATELLVAQPFLAVSPGHCKTLRPKKISPVRERSCANLFRHLATLSDHIPPPLSQIQTETT